jgi:hypothetical protein
LEERKMYFEESRSKKRDRTGLSIAGGFVWAGRFLVVSWAMLVILISVWGQALNFKG